MADKEISADRQQFEREGHVGDQESSDATSNVPGNRIEATALAMTRLARFAAAVLPYKKLIYCHLYKRIHVAFAIV